MVLGPMYHVHIVANRVGPDGRAAHLGFNYRTHELVSQEIAQEQGWRVVSGRFNRAGPAPDRRLPDAAFHQQRRSGDQPFENAYHDQILAAVENATSWLTLHRALADMGIVAKFKLKKGAKGQTFPGLAFAAGVSVDAPGCAASRIDAKCKYTALAARFGPWSESATHITSTPANHVGPGSRQAALPTGHRSIQNSRSTESDELWRRYQAYRSAQSASRSAHKRAIAEAWAAEKGRRTADSLARKTSYGLERTSVFSPRRHDPRRSERLFFLAQNARQQRAGDATAARVRWADTKARLAAQHQPVSIMDFHAWLAAQASRGDGAAARRLQCQRPHAAADRIATNIKEERLMKEKYEKEVELRKEREHQIEQLERDNADLRRQLEADRASAAQFVEDQAKLQMEFSRLREQVAEISAQASASARAAEQFNVNLTEERRLGAAKDRRIAELEKALRDEQSNRVADAERANQKADQLAQHNVRRAAQHQADVARYEKGMADLHVELREERASRVSLQATASRLLAWGETKFGIQLIADRFEEQLDKAIDRFKRARAAQKAAAACAAAVPPAPISLVKAAFEATLDKHRSTLERGEAFRQSHPDSTLPVLDMPEMREAVNALHDTLTHWSHVEPRHALDAGEQLRAQFRLIGHFAFGQACSEMREKVSKSKPPAVGVLTKLKPDQAR
jgi:regulator of replication initiation timing